MYLGIDLGTSNSVIAGHIDGQLRLFRTQDGGEVLPSVIYFDKRGHRLYGRRAYDLGMTQPEHIAAGFKRLMGTSTPIAVPGVELSLSAEECSAEIIRQLLGQAQTEMGGRVVAGAVITVPAAFNQMQLEATQRAANMAGLERVALLPEPVAAAMAAQGALSAGGGRKSGQFLIYDLGGGTFDVALAQSLQGEVSILAHQGINMLGGRDFDRMLVNEFVRKWLIDQFDLPDNFQRHPEYRRVVRAAALACEKAKIELSASENTKIFASDEDVRCDDESGDAIYLDIPLSRTQLENVIREPVQQTLDVVQQLLTEHGYAAADIDRVVFIGGPSRTPLIRQFISQQLGIAADLQTDPMTAVAMGAAIYCESREWGSAPAAAAAFVKPTDSSPSIPMPPVVEVSPSSGSGARKATQAQSGLAGEDVRFDYAARTPDDQAKIILRLASPPQGRTLEAETVSGWQSGRLDLRDGLVLSAPLANEGSNRVRITIFDAEGKALPSGSHVLTITRTAAAAAGVPATQTLAVKVLEHAESSQNILHPLVERGTLLPAEGTARYRAARDVAAGSSDALSLEIFQLEYPDKIELNLCVGVFRLNGADLPAGVTVKNGELILFQWNLTDSGLLQASVSLPETAGGITLATPRFYSPQAGQVSFDPETGLVFTKALLQQAEEDHGDVVAALGPEIDKELRMLRNRLDDQRADILENADDAEVIRRVAEETRFIRQDVARLAKKHHAAVLQRRLGKVSSIYNQVARPRANAEEAERFDAHAQQIQEALDRLDETAAADAERHLSAMRDLFFAAAWRDTNYVEMWFERLRAEAYLFPDQAQFQTLVQEGMSALAARDFSVLRPLVTRLLQSRVAITPSDSALDLASIMRDG